MRDVPASAMDQIRRSMQLVAIGREVEQRRLRMLAMEDAVTAEMAEQPCVSWRGCAHVYNKETMNTTQNHYDRYGRFFPPLCSTRSLCSLPRSRSPVINLALSSSPSIPLHPPILPLSTNPSLSPSPSPSHTPPLPAPHPPLPPSLPPPSTSTSQIPQRVGRLPVRPVVPRAVPKLIVARLLGRKLGDRGGRSDGDIPRPGLWGAHGRQPAALRPCHVDIMNARQWWFRGGGILSKEAG